VRGKLRFKTTFLIKVTFLLQLFMNISILFDIGILRQVLVFTFLAFVPGLVISILVGLNKIDLPYSIGLSLISIMLGGFALNATSSLFGINAPLSTFPILVSLNLLLVLLYSLCIVFRGKLEIEIGNGLHTASELLSLSTLLFPLLLILILGVFGIFNANLGDNRFLLLTVLCITPFLILPVILKSTPKCTVSMVLLLVSIIILFSVDNQNALITKYVHGQGDQYLEFQVFKVTEIDHIWKSDFAQSSTYYNDSITLTSYSMGSVTVLPAIFSQLSNIPDFWLFKLLYPIIVAIVPLGLYKLYSTQLEDKKMAFLAVIFFVIISVGKGWGSDKQLVAQLFYVLAFVCLFDKNLKPVQSSIFFLFFVGGLTLSHYGLAYIFMFSILLVFVISVFSEKRNGDRVISESSFLSLKTLSLYTFVASSSIILAWNSFAIGGQPLQRLVDTYNMIRLNLIPNFFNPQSRGTALEGLGFVQASTTINQVGALFFYLTEFLVLIGFIVVIARKSNVRFDNTYRIILAVNMGILLMNVLLPNLSDTFLMSRFYQTTLIFLAPLCVIGATEILRRLKIKELFHFPAFSLLLILLFLFQVGFIYEITAADTYSTPLSMHRWSNARVYTTIISDNDAFGACWLAKNNKNNAIIYADSYSSAQVLTSVGVIGRGQSRWLTNITHEFQDGAFIFLGIVANVDGRIFGDYTYNTSEIKPFLENQNKLYSNGECDIYTING